jgi:tetratricopeptide (TPR) repeat protein
LVKGTVYLDSFYNNLSWANQELGNYELALEYIEKALEIHPNDSVEYTNLGNCYYSLGDYDKALPAYEEAIKLNPKEIFALEGLGEISFANSEYEEAILAFEKAIKLKDVSNSSYSYLGLSYLYGRNMEEMAKKYIDMGYEKSPKELMTINAVAQYHQYLGELKEKEEFYLKALEQNSQNYDFLCVLSEYYRENKDYIQALKHLDNAITLDPKKHFAYLIKIKVYNAQELNIMVDTTIDTMLENCEEVDALYFDLAELFYNEYNYPKAAKYFDKTFELNNNYHDAVLGKVSSLFYMKYYTDCIELGKAQYKNFDSYDILWYVGSAYSEIGDNTMAIQYLEETKKMSGELPVLYNELGWVYFSEQNYEKSLAIANEVLEMDNGNEEAVSLKNSSEERLNNFGKVITDFMEDNYLYFYNNDDFQQLKAELYNKKDVSDEDIIKLFKSIYDESDDFSFVIPSEYYDEYLEERNKKTVTYSKIEDDIHYLKIDSFLLGTSNEFLDNLKGISNTEESYLIIDLRGNGGGATNSACNILDFLLEECVVANLIYSNGYSYPYYSDSNSIKFKEIFVFTDENSASSSELLALGLKTYLKNVTIIGDNTFGKGVGQLVYDDNQRKISLFLVNHYWNVRENNIMEKGVTPDIKLRSENTDDFIAKVQQVIGDNK